MKNTENSEIFQILQFCSILGVFQGSLEASLGCPEVSWRRLGGSERRLDASWRALKASWSCLGIVLGHLGGILDVSWGKYRKKVEGNHYFGAILEPKMEAKIIENHVEKAMRFS